MFTWIFRIAWLALSAFLLIRVGEALFSTDQSTSILPFDVGFASVDVPFLLAGVAWGVLMTFGMAFTGPSDLRRVVSRGLPNAVAPATVVDVDRTGVSVNDVPQYEAILEVQPTEGEVFLARFRAYLAAPEAANLQPGQLLAVRYSAPMSDDVELADPEDPEVADELLRWRIAHGLVREDLLRARTRGISQPASVLAVRPTGVRREGQVEIEVRLLVTPEDGADSFEADSIVFVHPEALSHVQVGSPVFAMYEPNRPDLVHMTITRQRGLS